MIFLIRHADAVQGDVDAERALSERGVGQVERLCPILSAAGCFNPSEFWHSPLVRAQETASRLARGLGSAAPLVLMPGLEPDDDPGPVAALLVAHPGDVAVVGHEPHLGVLASILVRGDSPRQVYYPFPKAGVLALARSAGSWQSEWLALSP